MKPEQRVRLESKLREQRQFLKRSLDLLCSGDLSEAVRVALVCRVLVHETGSSKPLLKLLAPNYLDLDILCLLRDSGARPVYFSTGTYSIENDMVYPAVALDLPALRLVPLGRWWEEVCLIVPVGLKPFSFLTRKNLLLTLANKEGGAHVDEALPEEYIRATQDRTIDFFGLSLPDVTRAVTAQCGGELLDYLDRHFPWATDANPSERTGK